MHFIFRMFAVHADYGLTLMFGLVLFFKYVFVDRHHDLLDIKHTMQLERSYQRSDNSTQTDEVQGKSYIQNRIEKNSLFFY